MLLRILAFIIVLCCVFTGVMNCWPEDPAYKWRWWFMVLALAIDAAMIVDTMWRVI